MEHTFQKEQCPNKCGELIEGSSRGVCFGDGEYEVTVDLFMDFCPECGYTGFIWRK